MKLLKEFMKYLVTTIYYKHDRSSYLMLYDFMQKQSPITDLRPPAAK